MFFEFARHCSRDDGRAITALRTAHFGGLPFARHYEALAEDSDVLQGLAGDRYGIGVVGFVDAASVPSGVRWVPLAENASAAASLADYADVEQAAFAPSTVVPGLGFSPGRMLQGRLFSMPTRSGIDWA